MQLELLKPEMVQKRLGIESTIVIFGSARIPPPEVAALQLAQAQRRRRRAGASAAPAMQVQMSRYYDEPRANSPRW